MYDSPVLYIMSRFFSAYPHDSNDLYRHKATLICTGRMHMCDRYTIIARAIIQLQLQLQVHLPMCLLSWLYNQPTSFHTF